MSRIALEGKEEGHTLIIGLDYALGWFYQLWGPEPEEGEEEEPLLDKCSMFDNVSQGEMLLMIKLHAKPTEKSQQCASRIAMDLDPGE